MARTLGAKSFAPIYLTSNPEAVEVLQRCTKAFLVDAVVHLTHASTREELEKQLAELVKEYEFAGRKRASE